MIGIYSEPICGMDGIEIKKNIKNKLNNMIQQIQYLTNVL